MPIERYTVGRSYTKRHRAHADDPKSIRTLMEELAASGPFTVEHRLEDAEQRARAYLEQAGMSLDPNQPPYGDPAWRRENERKSLKWYAIEILNTIRILRLQIERGDARLAADLALDLGVLATEARIVAERVGGQIRGGEGAKNSDYRIDKEDRDAAWRASAIEEWAKPGQRRLGAEKIAVLIEPDPTKHRNCRRIIGPLRPK